MAILKKETDESLFSDDTDERCDVFCIPNGTCGLLAQMTRLYLPQTRSEVFLKDLHFIGT